MFMKLLYRYMCIDYVTILEAMYSCFSTHTVVTLAFGFSAQPPHSKPNQCDSLLCHAV